MKNYIVTSRISGQRWFCEANSPGDAREAAWNIAIARGQENIPSLAEFVAATFVTIQEGPLPPKARFDDKPEDHDLEN